MWYRVTCHLTWNSTLIDSPLVLDLGRTFYDTNKSENIEMKLQEDLVTSESTWRMENKPRKTQMKEIHTACQWQVLRETRRKTLNNQLWEFPGFGWSFFCSHQRGPCFSLYWADAMSGADSGNIYSVHSLITKHPSSVRCTWGPGDFFYYAITVLCNKLSLS